MSYGIHVKARLQDKVDSAWHRIANHRSARERIWRSYIGDNHGLSMPGSRSVPLNGHALYVRSLIQFLAAHQPKLMISTDVGPWKASMESLEYQASRVMREERFGFKQQRWVMDALIYSPGILKIAQEWRRVPQGDEGDYAEVLKTCVSNVDANDWVFDTAASSVYDADFTGHRVRLAVEDVIANPMFGHIDPEVLYGMSGTITGGDERLFFENDDTSQPYRETITLWNVWDRCQNRIKIWPADGPSIEFYNEPWEGHSNGDLHYLDFLDVPNHVVGLSPLCILQGLIEATNRSLNKVINQTDVAKTIMRMMGGNKGEAEAIMAAMDGQGVLSEGGGIVEMMTVGGPDPRTLQMVPILKDLTNWLGGNVDVVGGLSTGGADTATQGRLLSQASSGMVNFMQARTQEAVRLAAEAIVHAELTDSVTNEMIPTQLADGQTFWKKFTPEEREKINAILINVDIDVFSMQYRSPQQRLDGLMQWWTQVAMPGYQIWQQQGGEYDMQAFMRHYAKLSDEPIINDIALYSSKPQSQSGGGSAPVPIRQSPVTTRTNVRMDRGGPSQELGGQLALSLGRMGEAA